MMATHPESSTAYRDPEVLESLYVEEGLNGADIADRFGVDVSTIHNWIRRHDISRTEPWKDPDYLHETYLEEEWSMDDIADATGCTHTTVYYWLQKHGIPIRDVGGTRREYARYQMNAAGYMHWQAFNSDDRTTDSFYVHRLLAIAKYGLEAVAGNDVHHKNGIPWDNRPENIEVLDRAEHARLHGGDV